MQLSRRAVISVLLAAAICTAAHAQRNLQDAATFTAADEAVIARNELLTRLRRSNPDGARDILDALARPRRSGPVDPGQPRRPKDAQPKIPFDPEGNPDLLTFYRASPEAAHDLLQLLKQAGAGRR